MASSFKDTTIDGTLNALTTDTTARTGDYTLALTDRDKVVLMNNTATATVTVPLNSSIAFPIGSTVYVYRANTGTVTLAAAVGVTLSKTGNFGANEQITLRKRATDSWVVIDNTSRLTGTGGTLTSSGGVNSHTYTSTGSTTFVVS